MNDIKEMVRQYGNVLDRAAFGLDEQPSSCSAPSACSARYDMQPGMGQCWVRDRHDDNRLIAMCTRGEDAQQIVAVLNAHVQNDPHEPLPKADNREDG